MRTIVASAVVLLACQAPSNTGAGDARSVDAAHGDTPYADAWAVDSPLGPVDAVVATGDPMGAFIAQSPVCGSAGWCWMGPTPSGTNYTEIVSTDPNNIWIAGGGPPSYAAILQWNGVTWRAHQPPEPACVPNQPCGYSDYLYPMGIASSGPNNTWLLYTNLIEHWDGTAWQIVQVGTGTYHSVWVDPNGDAWITDYAGTLTRWHGTTPTVVASPGTLLGGVWGTGARDVFVSTIGGIYHYDGTTFSLVYSGSETAASYEGAPGDVWIGGEQGALLHWDGTAVTDVSAQIAPAISPHALVRGAQYLGGSDATWISTGASLSPEYLIHWDGTQLTSAKVDTFYTAHGDNACSQLGGVAVIAGKWWLMCGGGEVATRIGATTFASVLDELPMPGDLWGTSPNDLYVALGYDTRHWDGAAWTNLSRRLGLITGIAGTGAGSSDELFGIDLSYDGSSSSYREHLEHYDGSAWTETKLGAWVYQEDPAENVAAVYPLGHDEAFIVGANGYAAHYQAGQVQLVKSGTTAALAGVWGPDADHLWISGSSGTLLQWTRATPDVLTVDPSLQTSDDLGELASAEGVTWMLAGNQNHVWMHSAATGWTPIATPLTPVQIGAISATNAVATATDVGLAMRWNGSSFAIEPYPNGMGNQHVAVVPGGTTYLLGQTGILMHP